MVFATIFIIQLCPVSTQRTVTFPAAESPGFVEVYESQILALAAGRIGSAVTVSLVPSGVPKPPVGPAVISKVSSRQVTTSHTMARCVVTPTPPIPAGTALNSILGVIRLMDSAG
jgi:hypothetical protein